MDIQKTITVIIFIAVAFISGIFYGQSRGDTELAEIRSNLDAAESTNQQLETTIQRLTNAYSEIERQLDNYRERIRQQQAIINAITKGLETSGGTINEIDSANQTAQGIVKKLLDGLTNS